MQFSQTSTEKAGILQAVERNTRQGDASITGVTTALAEVTNYCNEVNRELWSLIWKAYGGWQYDDSNQTFPANAAQNLTSGTSNYTLPSGNLAIKGVEVKNTDGIWLALQPITEEQIRNGTTTVPGTGQLYLSNSRAVGNFFTTPGTPLYYGLQGQNVILYPAPNWTQANSLKIFFDRGSYTFLTTDTTKTPGFASEFHDLIPLGASCIWFELNSPEDLTYPALKRRFEAKKIELQDFYHAQSSRLFKPRMMSRNNFDR